MLKYRKELLKSVIEQKYDEKLFLAIAQELIQELDLMDYVKNVSLSEISEKRVKGNYDGTNIEIDEKSTELFTLFQYRSLFTTLFHELEHAKQRKLIAKYDEYYYKLPEDHIYTLEERKELAITHAIGMSYKIKDLKKRTYNLSHDLFPAEHSANYNGYINAINFLVEMLPEFRKSLTNPNRHNYKLMELLLRGYKIKILTGKLMSPFEQILIKDIKPYVKNILLGDNELSDYEKMILGLPIDKDLFLRLYNQLVNHTLPNDINESIYKK